MIPHGIIPCEPRLSPHSGYVMHMAMNTLIVMNIYVQVRVIRHTIKTVTNRNPVACRKGDIKQATSATLVHTHTHKP